MTQFSAGESWDQMRFPENYCAIVGIGKGVESLETERKEPGGHSPCIVDPQGGKGSHRLQVPRAQGPLLRGLLHPPLVSSLFSLYFLLGSPPLFLSLLCLLSLPHGCCPILTFSYRFLLSPSLQLPLSSPLLFLLSGLTLSGEGKLPRKPPIFQLWRKRLASGVKPFLLSVGNK